MTDATSTISSGRLGYNTVNAAEERHDVREYCKSSDFGNIASLRGRVGCWGAQDRRKQKESSTNNPVQ